MLTLGLSATPPRGRVLRVRRCAEFSDLVKGSRRKLEGAPMLLFSNPVFGGAGWLVLGGVTSHRVGG